MPHTSSGLNKHVKKQKKSKEFINETESLSEETNSEKELNILSRPKRNIILNMDGLIAAQTMPDTDSDEDDEDFKIDFKSDDDDDDSDSSSSSGSSNSNDENEVNEQKEVKVETKIEKKKTKKATISKQKTPSKTIKKGTQIRKNKIKKLIEMKKIESNQEIEKIFSKFKNVNNTKNIKNSTSSTTNILNKQIQKEKLPAIIDPLNLKDWICSLCHNKPNAFDYLGPLFGPYRISLTSDDSWSDDIKSGIYYYNFTA